MTKEEILEGNKLIAQFLGLTIITDEISLFDTNYKPLAKYHESWNDLMPVVEKIENIDLGHWYVHIIGGKEYSTVKIEDGNDGIGLWDCMINVPDCVGFGGDVNLTKIEAVYKAVVEFIKWYNEKLSK